MNRVEEGILIFGTEEDATELFKTWNIGDISAIAIDILDTSEGHADTIRSIEEDGINISESVVCAPPVNEHGLHNGRKCRNHNSTYLIEVEYCTDDFQDTLDKILESWTTEKPAGFHG